MIHLKKILFTAIALSSFLLQSCFFSCVDGEGEVVTETLSVDDYEEISLDFNADLEIIPSAESKVVIEAYENLLAEMDIEVRGDELELGSENCINSDRTIKIKAYGNNLTGITLNGSGIIYTAAPIKSESFELKINGSGDVQIAADVEDFECKINGSGDVNLSGKTDHFEVKINGSGEVNAKKLIATKKTVKINGSGDVMLSDCDNLETSINGSGDVDCSDN